MVTDGQGDVVGSPSSAVPRAQPDAVLGELGRGLGPFPMKLRSDAMTKLCKGLHCPRQDSLPGDCSTLFSSNFSLKRVKVCVDPPLRCETQESQGSPASWVPGAVRVPLHAHTVGFPPLGSTGNNWKNDFFCLREILWGQDT